MDRREHFDPIGEKFNLIEHMIAQDHPIPLILTNKVEEYREEREARKKFLLSLIATYHLTEDCLKRSNIMREVYHDYRKWWEKNFESRGEEKKPKMLSRDVISIIRHYLREGFL